MSASYPAIERRKYARLLAKTLPAVIHMNARRQHYWRFSNTWSCEVRVICAETTFQAPPVCT